MSTDADVTVADLLRRLCSLMQDGVDVEVDGVGVMLTHAVPFSFLHAEPSSSMVDVERIQERLRFGPCAESINRRQAVVVDDLASSTRWSPLTGRPVWAGIGAVLAMPLLASGRAWGALGLYRSRAQAWSSHDLAVVGMFADVAASYVAVAAARDEASIVRRRLEQRISDVDLNSLPDRRLLSDRIEHAMLSVTRHRRSVGVMFVDIDGFKEMNATLGQAQGDLVLAEVARRLRQTLRRSDTLARLSGDDFVIICEDLPGSPAQIARWLHALGRRIRIDLRQPPRGAEMELVVSVSIGAVITTQPRTAPDLLAEADQAMYRAKRRGGGRLVISTLDAARSPVHLSGRPQQYLSAVLPDHGREVVTSPRGAGSR
jgi:diguanylate cyclase (GGDEF)-like protein